MWMICKSSTFELRLSVWRYCLGNWSAVFFARRPTKSNLLHWLFSQQRSKISLGFWVFPCLGKRAYANHLTDNSLASLLHLEGHILAWLSHQLCLKTLNFWFTVVADVWDKTKHPDLWWILRALYAENHTSWSWLNVCWNTWGCDF